MKDGDDIKQGGIYAATKARLKNMMTPDAVEQEVRRMLGFGEIYASLLQPQREEVGAIRHRLEHIKELAVTTSYPLLLRLFDTRKSGAVDDAELEKCLGLIESFIVRRAVCGVPTNALNKLFLQWSRNFPDKDYVAWLHTSMSSGRGGRRFPSDAEFGEAFKNQPQYGRGATRFILCQLEKAIAHKEPVDLSSATIEHIMPQTLTQEWKDELGDDAEQTHSRLVDTFGNLTLTAYNSELGNLEFSKKKAKLETTHTHVELNHWVLMQTNWREKEIGERAEELLRGAKTIWMGPVATN